MMRRWISLLLVCCMLISALPVTAFAGGTEVASGTCGENLTWVLDSEGTLTISGSGPMDEFGEAWDAYGGEEPWQEYKDSIITVIMEEGITYIDTFAFQSYTNLQKVTIPGSVTSIGYYHSGGGAGAYHGAFSGCSNLNSIGPIGSGCDYEFGWTESVPDGAFYGIPDVNKIIMPETITSIGDRAFSGFFGTPAGKITSAGPIGSGCDYEFGWTKEIADGAFQYMWALKSVEIPETVTSIGKYAFSGCRNLSALRLPDGLTEIGDYAFMDCSGFTECSLPENLKTIGAGAFSGCSSLQGIDLPDGLEFLGNSAFSSCTQLKSIELPEKITTVSRYTFGGCGALENVTLPETLTAIEDSAFSSCISLREIALPENLTTLGGWAFSGCTALRKIEIPGSVKTIGKWVFPNCTGLKRAVLKDGVTAIGDSAFSGCTNLALIEIPDDLKTVGASAFSGCTGLKDIYYAGSQEAWKSVRIGSKNTDFTNATVHYGEAAPEVKPAGLAITALYDTQQYYHGGGFYSAVSSLTNSAELYFEFSNKQPEGADSAEEFAAFESVTFTATVSGNDLSFSRETYQNTYTAQLGDIDYGKIVPELLSLYPVNPEFYHIGYRGNDYTVTIKLDSESFEEPVVETYTFTILDAEQQKVEAHTEFALHDTYYKVFKKNAYGKNMLGVKDDPEYLWSKWSSFDFENYYEVVMADLLIGMLDVPQAEFSIVPKVLKDWYKSYESLLGDIDKIVTNDYGDAFDISETKIDKILKSSKYKSPGGNYMEDPLYLAVVDILGDEVNAKDIRDSFAKIDKTKQVFELVSMVKDPLNEIIAWGNTLSVLNAFDEADQELKDVFRALANEIPSEEYLMREAVLDYVNYATDYSGKVREIYDSFFEAAGKVTASSFKNVVGKKLWDCMAIKAVEWIGTIPLKGGTKLASTSVYQTLTSASAKAVASGVLTGVSIGLTLSDLICSSSSKASEMGKLIAMCEYSPYVINVLVKCEAGLIQNQNMESVLLFENAFKLHQATQSYILNQTANALKVKADSILQKLLGNEEYYAVVSDTLAQKRTVDAMNCCGSLSGETVVHTTKVISVRCPVNVEVFRHNGSEQESVVIIENEEVKSCADNIEVYIRDGEKFIAVPADGDYSVKITAYGSGTVDYSETEYDDSINRSSLFEKLDIPITENEVLNSNDFLLPEAVIDVSRMILGNELAMQYAFKQESIDPDTEYVVSITKTYADGRDDKVIQVPESQWKTTNVSGKPYFYVSFNGIAAKEMNDEIRVQIMTADGIPAGPVFTTSVSEYALNQLRKTNVAATRTLYVDMLNYGSAAQTYFNYDAGNLSNADLTETEKGYATKTVKLENKLIKGTGYSASQLDLGSSILLRVRFNGIDSSMHAVVSFTNHTGRKIESRIEGTEFLYSGTVVVIDDVVAADYAQDVTVKVYDVNGEEVANAVESVASYLARQLDKPGALAIYDAVAKYCASAYAYLHR